jgi:hypothetical protein
MEFLVDKTHNLDHALKLLWSRPSRIRLALKSPLSPPVYSGNIRVESTNEISAGQR